MRTLLRILLTVLLLAGPLAALAHCGFEFGFDPDVKRIDETPAGLRLNRAQASDGEALHFTRPVVESLDAGMFFNRQFWLSAAVTDSAKHEAAQAARAGSLLSPVHGIIPEAELRLLIPDDQASRRAGAGPGSAASETTRTGAPVHVPEPSSWLLTTTGASLLAVIAIRRRRHP